MPYIPGAALGGRRVDLGSAAFGAVDGAGVAWHILGMDGWDGPDQQAEYTAREADHGAWASPVYLRQRPITLTGKLEAPSLALLDTAIEQLIEASSLEDTILTVYESTPKQATVRRSGPTLVRPITDRIAEYSVLVTAADPRRYSTILQSQSAALPSATGGLTLPLTLPLTITAATASGTITLVNEGSFATRPILSVTGPCTGGFTIGATRPDGTSTLQTYSDDLGADDVLVLDSDARTATLNDQVSRRRYLSGTWPEIPARSSITFNWTCPNYSADALLSGTCRSAWM